MDMYGWYPGKGTGLMAAAFQGFNDLARALIHNHANINVRNKHGFTTLLLASYAGSNDLIGILLDLGAHVNLGDKYGIKPLHAAAYSGHVSTVRLLLERGADINARTLFEPPFQWTALEMASNYRLTEVVALLQSWGR